MTAAPTAYRLDRNLNLYELGPVSLEEAKHMVDARFASLQPRYDTGEEALSETMFGFSRADDEFIELCIHDFASVSCRIELPSLRSWWRRLIRGFAEFKAELHSRDEVIEIVTAFFRFPEREFAMALRQWSRAKGGTLPNLRMERTWPPPSGNKQS